VVDDPELVSVVIPTRDGASTLSDVLRGLANQRAPFRTEVVAIDSGSRDGTCDLLKRYGVRVYRISPDEFNHGETRNLGIRLSKGDPIVLLTQDAIPADAHLLTALVKGFVDDRVAGVYGRQIPRHDCDEVTRRNLQSWLTARPEPSLSLKGDRRLTDMDPVEAFHLCVFDNVCSAIRREVWEEIPFPRSAFGEDLGWGRQVVDQGWGIAYRPDAAVIHSHRRSLRYEYRRTRICHERLYELFGVALVPDWRALARGVLSNVRRDLPFVWKEAPKGPERLRQLSRALGLAVTSPLAQYHGLRDARWSRESVPRSRSRGRRARI